MCAQPYVGEIRLFAGNFAPASWAFCDGQLMQIADNEVLFQLIGTTYGGDGQETFGLPDLRGRVPLHMGQGPGLQSYVIGEAAGVEDVTLTVPQLPSHSHALTASTGPGVAISPQNAVLGASPDVTMYLRDGTTTDLPPATAGPVGGSQPHDNVMPTLTLSYIISLYGIFPSQT
ncbi:tail fiber protein [Patulibacter sp. SYSU D01012]|uniref:phage tail protein n=1 Tax=Patulibacter sp. SYSU D01012 TaxID=2817381 RepID=UPI001B3103C5|nr:tail fiber protein [Patulibacter sp. SYSU D01012]